MKVDYHYHPEPSNPRLVQLITDGGQILDEGVQIKSSEGIELIIYGDNLVKQGETFASYAQSLSRDCLVVVPYVFLKSDRKRDLIKGGWRDDYILGDIPQRPHSFIFKVSTNQRQRVAEQLRLGNVCELFGSDALLPCQTRECYTEINFKLPYTTQSFKLALQEASPQYWGSYYPSWKCFLISVILLIKSRLSKV